MSPSTAFKYLVIQRCNNLTRIQISDANLVSFVNEADGLQSNKVDLHLKNLPLLVEVSLGGRRSIDFLEVAFQICCCLAQLEVLKLNEFSMIYRRESVFPTLCNLKHLELPLHEDDDSALLQLSSFMKAAPLLHTLVLQLRYSMRRKGPFPNKKAAKCLHNNLKVVEIVRYIYTCTTRHIDLVKYVTKAAMNLEKIVFHSDCDRDYRSRVRLVQTEFELVERRKECLSHVRMIKKKLPASVEVVCL
ncbi:PREDICTED: uncharacterized protein LOC101295569 [Fragaria vesca subsp. vesca]|uniref:uncharacterized protein LOC101295569 n=1 Tax=Fragaria vesca subsp. vesca TaxID=101020 RepID=UPI0002C3437F|nr:PREDICTED: uncharacterized protein LOC101295569 [Fragaria vesca subsp. vesca]